jgi:hypothetical protein
VQPFASSSFLEPTVLQSWALVLDTGEDPDCVAHFNITIRGWQSVKKPRELACANGSVFCFVFDFLRA